MKVGVIMENNHTAVEILNFMAHENVKLSDADAFLSEACELILCPNSQVKATKLGSNIAKIMEQNYITTENKVEKLIGDFFEILNNLTIPRIENTV